MPTATYNYDALGRLRSVLYEDHGKMIYDYDAAGNRIVAYSVPPCCIPSFLIIPKTGSFTASDGAGAYYLITGTATVTLPPSPADGGVMKFKVLSGTTTLTADGTEEINNPNGTSDSTLVMTARSGVLELIAVPGGWDVT